MLFTLRSYGCIYAEQMATYRVPDINDIRHDQTFWEMHYLISIPGGREDQYQSRVCTLRVELKPGGY